MTTPLLDLEGTWEEIVAQIPDFSGQKLRVLVYPATGNSAEASDTRPIAEVLAEIAAALQMPDMTMFTEQEMRTIQRVIQQYGEDTASVLAWKSHQESAWLFADDWRPLNLTPEKQSTGKDGENSEAIVLLEQWYATPDDKPPGYWDDLLQEIEAHPLHFGDEDLGL